MAKTIADYKKDYEKAKQSGDAKGMKAANDGANKVREITGQKKEVASRDISNTEARQKEKDVAKARESLTGRYADAMIRDNARPNVSSVGNTNKGSTKAPQSASQQDRATPIREVQVTKNTKAKKNTTSTKNTNTTKTTKTANRSKLVNNTNTVPNDVVDGALKQTAKAIQAKNSIAGGNSNVRQTTSGNGDSTQIKDLSRQSWEIYNQTGRWDTPAQRQLHNQAEMLRGLSGYSGGADGSQRINVKTSPAYFENTLSGGNYDAGTFEDIQYDDQDRVLMTVDGKHAIHVNPKSVDKYLKKGYGYFGDDSYTPDQDLVKSYYGRDNANDYRTPDLPSIANQSAPSVDDYRTANPMTKKGNYLPMPSFGGYGNGMPNLPTYGLQALGYNPFGTGETTPTTPTTPTTGGATGAQPDVNQILAMILQRVMPNIGGGGQ